MSDLAWDKDFALEQAADDQELLDELIQIFKDSSAADFIKIQEGLEKGDLEQTSGAAHSIKGAAASLGVEGLREITYAIEADCRGGSLVVVKERLAELADLLEQLDKL